MDFKQPQTTPTRAPHARLASQFKTSANTDKPQTDSAPALLAPENISQISGGPHAQHAPPSPIQRPAGASNQDNGVSMAEGFHIHRPQGSSNRQPFDRPIMTAQTAAPSQPRAEAPLPKVYRSSPSSGPHKPASPKSIPSTTTLQAAHPQVMPRRGGAAPHMPTRPHERRRGPQPSAPAVNLAPRWSREPEARFIIEDLPPEWHTQEIHRILLPLGNVTDIHIPQEQSNPTRRHAYATFKPPPANYRAVQAGMSAASQVSGRKHNITLAPRDQRDSHSVQKGRNVDASATRLDFGVMKNEETTLGLHTVQATPNDSVEVSVDTTKKQLNIAFSVPTSLMSQNRNSHKMPAQWRYRMEINFAQITDITQMDDPGSDATSLVLSVEAPPKVYRRTEKPLESHEEDSREWRERYLWYRQTEIEQNLDVARQAVKQLQRDNSIIDIGRWLTYSLTFGAGARHSRELERLLNVLETHSISLDRNRVIKSEFAATKAMKMWSWLDSPAKALNNKDALSSLSDLQQMAHQTIQLPFKVRYQLESCISHGCIHESNIDRTFLETLSNMAAESEHGAIRTVKLLEKVVDEGKRFYNPNDIFKKVVPNMRGVFKQRQHATHFIKVLTATVTPTTIYFNAPALEPSNRVIRHFRQYEDRFLRVRFAEEKYEGKIHGNEDAQSNEIFTRVKRTMTNGIKVGDRVYEFLAFGNSQFREGGAYFFAAAGELNAAKIRDWMGDFSHIKIVAKYCSRIGQCLSTTRSTQYRTFKEVKIPDIELNGFCFSDGVGKISPMLAVLISSEIGMLKPHGGMGNNGEYPYPSAFQFRMGGCKGILVVDPAMGSDRRVSIRPSQEKFSMAKHAGLEICRISQFTNASLNVQIILVLSALGVPDEVFTDMMDDMLSDIELAMTNEGKAIELLQRNIDLNGTTVQIAQMILDGFMEREDPFTISCLRLWRSWNLKYLKERQRIFVEHGAFVLGCIDETATLEGHYNDDPHALPEIFLQIPDREHEGRYKVVEGVCMLARNPSLHPGDVRVVRAVPCEPLKHIRDCVVLPQKGDRDIANMCSGGDLDGDDYMIIWDEKLLPKEWNHPPMDYQASPPVEATGKITVDDMTSFFVTHMKYDNVGRIANLHKCWADKEDEGVKSAKCLRLAALHSQAVDYAKTGQPAKLPRDLQMSMRPHWLEKARTTYKSKKVIGKLYDRVKRVDFVPAWDLPFDARILDAFQLDEAILETARDLKEQYDDAVRRIMAKYSIKNEFEVWTTFVLEHGESTTDYKFSEKIGEEAFTLKERFQKLCHESISSDEHEQRDWARKGPLVAAMYTVTAQEVEAALAECAETKIVGGEEVPVRQKTADTMPFMSFPWLFPNELGWIANKRTGYAQSVPLRAAVPKSVQKAEKAKLTSELLGDVPQPAPLEELVLPELHMGESDEEENLLDVYHSGTTPMRVPSPARDADAALDASAATALLESRDAAFGIDSESDDDLFQTGPRTDTSEIPDISLASDLRHSSSSQLPPALATLDLAEASSVDEQVSSAEKTMQDGQRLSSDLDDEFKEGDEESDEEAEQVVLTAPVKKSAFDALEELLES